MATASAVKKVPFKGLSRKEQTRFHRWVCKELPSETYRGASVEETQAAMPDIEAIIKKWCDLSREKQIPVQVIAIITWVRMFPNSWQAEMVNKSRKSDYYRKTQFIGEAVLKHLGWAETAIYMLLSLEEA
jgi:hypothetical protein